MKFLSVCSGIEAASCAWKPLGWEAVAFSEIEPFPCSVLAHHYPNVPNWGDMTKFKEWPDVSIDILCGGTPCQSFSVAGLRKGLDDPRGNLMLTYGAIAAKYRPKWLVWENVPGVLSSNGGRDFGSFLGLLGQLGYGFAYRVLDAQYFGVAQRRRRVFVVGCLGDWRAAAAVLFERHSLSGHPAPSRQARKVVAGTISKCSFDGGAGGRPEGAAGNHFLAVPHAAISPAIKARDHKGASSDGDGDGAILVPMVVGSLACNTGPNGHGFGDFLNSQAVDAGHILPVAFAQKQRDEVRVMDVAGALAAEPGAKQQTYFAVPMVNMQGSKGNAVAQGDGPSFTLNAMHGHDVHAIAVPVLSNDPATAICANEQRTYTNEGSVFKLRNVVGQPVQVAAYGFQPRIARNGRGDMGDVAGTLNAQSGETGKGDAAPCVAVAYVGGVDYENNGFEIDEPCGPLMKGSPTGGGRPLPAVAFNHYRTDASPGEVCPTLQVSKGSGVAGAAVAVDTYNQTEQDTAHTIRAGAGMEGVPATYTAMQVRRLTPVECERLQGFPDGYTAIPWRGKPADQCPDGPRYKALGNSWAVPCAQWIGQRIEAVEQIAQMRQAA